MPSYELEDGNSSYMLAINKEEGNVIHAFRFMGNWKIRIGSPVELKQVGNDYYLDEMAFLLFMPPCSI